MFPGLDPKNLMTRMILTDRMPVATRRLGRPNDAVGLHQSEMNADTTFGTLQVRTACRRMSTAIDCNARRDARKHSAPPRPTEFARPPMRPLEAVRSAADPVRSAPRLTGESGFQPTIRTASVGTPTAGAGELASSSMFPRITLRRAAR